jgi:hypothetical protein
MGDGQWAMGNGKPEARSRKREAGSGKPEAKRWDEPLVQRDVRHAIVLSGRATATTP